MKKFVAIAVLCSCVAALFAGDFELKDIMKNNKIGDEKPTGWNMNGKPAKGSGVIVQGSEKDEKAFKISAPVGGTAFYRLSPTKAKAGDKVKLSAKVKGTGTFSMGFYTYKGVSGYFPAVDASKSVALTDKFQEVEFEFVVKNGAKGEVCDYIRPFVRSNGKSEAIVEDFEFEVEYAD